MAEEGINQAEEGEEEEHSLGLQGTVHQGLSDHKQHDHDNPQFENADSHSQITASLYGVHPEQRASSHPIQDNEDADEHEDSHVLLHDGQDA